MDADHARLEPKAHECAADGMIKGGLQVLIVFIRKVTLNGKRGHECFG